MTRLLCRNKVADYDSWWRVFSSHAEAHRKAGLFLEHLWRSREDPNNVFFVFEVRDIAAAKAFMDAPNAAEAASESDVVESEYHFVTSEARY